jgi:cell wall-associated NlpC family hydrolase
LGGLLEQGEHYRSKYENALQTMPTWITRYLDIPYRHLGASIEKGIDCGNLCATVIKEQTGEDVGYKTSDFCDIVDEDWYKKTHQHIFDEFFKNEKYGMIEVDNLQPFDIIIMSIGSTNISNHCSLYIGNGKMLQTMINHNSWIAPYGKWYQRYTTGKFRWKNFNF